MSINAATPDIVFPPIFAALDAGSRELIGRSGRGNECDDADDSSESPLKKRFPLFLLVMIVVIAGVAISSHKI
ncbi:MAG: hypothetical protein ACKVHE_26375, partial [Planctomycetales bacterium]